MVPYILTYMNLCLMYPSHLAGAFDEANTCFTETDAVSIHDKFVHRFSSQNMQPRCQDLMLDPAKDCSTEESSPIYSKNCNGHILQSSPRDCPRVLVSQVLSGQPTQSNLSHLSCNSTPSPIIVQVVTCISL